MKNRLKEDIVASGRFGREPERRVDAFDILDPENGVTRPTGTEANAKVRAYAMEKMEEAGLDVRMDAVGNIFGRKKGSDPGVGAVMCGSHLDSVVNGGQLDGALGVFSAIEAVRRLNDEGYTNRRPIEVAVFTGEEGSAFGMTLLGSTALVGKMSYEDALARKNPEGRMLKEVLENSGYAGEFVMDLKNVEYFVELHIEQGPVLYNKKMPIGIVENIAGITWVYATIRGEGNHAGTTPMKMRKDALVAAAEIILFVEKRANEMVDKLGSATVGTVGKLTVFPNGTNIVPGRVELGIDIRDVVPAHMESLKGEVSEALKALEEKYGVSVDVSVPPFHSPEPLSPEVVDIIEKSAAQTGVRTMRMNSGAGHDSQNIASRVKTGMIFVPSVGGISHAPMEWTEWEDIETGAKVLTQTLRNLAGS
ncbi:MAG: Zn-dependent hydrolase [Spirochaetes bacterium]|nr:Zn-dependent hydrolase [Spirochaetota bacterium]